MEILVSLSKETSTSVAELLQMPAHYVIGIYNALKKIFKEEKKARDEEEKRQREETTTPSMPSMPSFNIPNFTMPKF